MENYPQFLFFLTTAGLSHPVLASLAGVIYLAGRIAFAKGYYTGELDFYFLFLQVAGLQNTYSLRFFEQVGHETMFGSGGKLTRKSYD